MIQILFYSFISINMLFANALCNVSRSNKICVNIPESLQVLVCAAWAAAAGLPWPTDIVTLFQPAMLIT